MIDRPNFSCFQHFILADNFVVSTVCQPHDLVDSERPKDRRFSDYAAEGDGDGYGAENHSNIAIDRSGAM